MEVTSGITENGKRLFVINIYTFGFREILDRDAVNRWQRSK